MESSADVISACIRDQDRMTTKAYGNRVIGDRHTIQCYTKVQVHHYPRSMNKTNIRKCDFETIKRDVATDVFL